MRRVLVTGASGFVGNVLCGTLSQAGYLVRAAVRDLSRAPPSAAERILVTDLGPTTPWEAALQGVDSVVHLAARAHVIRDSPLNAPLYLQANALGTLHLARQCARAGVRRFVYMSSVKVNGESTSDRAFTELDPPRPRDAYGTSKWEGERHAFEVGEQSGMEVAVVRSPLMYGPGVKGNFLRLLRWVDQRRLLPLGSVSNQRSLVSIWNLCDLLVAVLENSRAAGRIWMVSDGDDMSTPELIRRIARAMNRRAALIAVPVRLLEGLAAATGYRAELSRLCGSLVVDVSGTRHGLGWAPPIPVDEALRRTARWYTNQAGANV